MKILQYNARAVEFMEKVITRFAPSPTGLMHIGGVRTALYAFLTARKNNGKFFLRIEDTDRKRLVPEAIPDIIESLKWLGLDFEGEPIIQSERKELYEKYAKELVQNKLAYEQDGAIWFKMPKKKIEYADLIGNRKIEFEIDSQKDFVILKSDGFPTYHLAHVVDDHLMEADPIIRAEEWMSSVPKHISLFEAFGWEIPSYAHLPLILGPDRSKLSKRHGARSVLEFKKEGFFPEAILNYMAFLGWTPKSGKEILSIDEMISEFDLKDVHSTPAVFDIEKLKWMSGMYIRQAKPDELRSRLRQGFDGQAKIKNIDEETLDKLVPLAQTRMTTLNDFYELTEYFFEQPSYKLNDKEKDIAKEVLDMFSTMKQWNNEAILLSLKEIMKAENIKMPLVYKIITGHEKGLPLPEALEILGKEKTLKRLKNLV